MGSSMRLTYFQARALYAINRRGALLGDGAVMCARLVEGGAFFHTYCQTPIGVIGMRRLRSSHFVDISDWPIPSGAEELSVWPFPSETGELRAWNCAEVRDVLEVQLERRAKECANKELRAPDSKEMQVDAAYLQTAKWRGELPPTDGYTQIGKVSGSVFREAYDQIEAEARLGEDPTLVGFSRDQLLRPYVAVGSEISGSHGFVEIPGRVIVVVDCFYLFSGSSPVDVLSNGPWLAVGNDRGMALWRQDEDVTHTLPDCLMW